MSKITEILAKQQVKMEELEQWHLALLKEFSSIEESEFLELMEVEGNFDAITTVIGWVRHDNPNWRPKDSEYKS